MRLIPGRLLLPYPCRVLRDAPTTESATRAGQEPRKHSGRPVTSPHKAGLASGRYTPGLGKVWECACMHPPFPPRIHWYLLWVILSRTRRPYASAPKEVSPRYHWQKKSSPAPLYARFAYKRFAESDLEQPAAQNADTDSDLLSFRSAASPAAPVSGLTDNSICADCT